MEDLTIGGLSMGLGMETNSHRLGLMQENVVGYDVVLSTGQLYHHRYQIIEALLGTWL